MAGDSIGEEYVRLALAIDQHAPGYVDAYFGPPDWKQQAEAAGVRPLSELTARASDLAGAVADATAMDMPRKEYLARHVLAMRGRLRLLEGERMPLIDETDLLYDVRPTWLDEAVFKEGQRQLDELLPGGATLLERMTVRRQALEIPVERAKELLPAMAAQMRDLSRGRFPLPEVESVEFHFVQNQPWAAYNWYLGGGRSSIEINTDLPLHVNALPELIAHEAYPGHHTELSIKDSRLVQQAGQLEHCVALLSAPSCVIAEGLATCALSTLMPEASLVAWYEAELFPRAGLTGLDAQREYQIDRAWHSLDGVTCNAAFLLHDRGAGVDEVVSYLQEYGLNTEREARKLFDFIAEPSARAYIFTYHWGHRLLTALFDRKKDATHWYRRLLVEAVTPSQITEWMLE